jgi:uncharacterized protein (TIGR04255 family)
MSLNIPPSQKLGHPPIAEAVIDLRTTGTAIRTPEATSLLRAQLSGRFPIVEELRSYEALLEFPPQGVPRAQARDTGSAELMFRDKDRLYALQCRASGMSLSRLKPYESFEALFELFGWCWPIYARAFAVDGSVRAGLRYINRFPVPPKGVLNEHLVLPEQAPIENLTLLAHLGRNLFVDRSTAQKALVTTSLEPSSDGGDPAVVIDIDAFEEFKFPVPFEAAEASLSSLRTLKNRLFFALLGPDALSRFS